jgi:hypothetical protein
LFFKSGQWFGVGHGFYRPNEPIHFRVQYFQLILYPVIIFFAGVIPKIMVGVSFMIIKHFLLESVASSVILSVFFTPETIAAIYRFAADRPEGYFARIAALAASRPVHRNRAAISVFRSAPAFCRKACPAAALPSEPFIPSAVKTLSPDLFEISHSFSCFTLRDIVCAIFV